MDLDTVTDALYRLAPTKFIAERDKAATRARSDGDESLAAQVKKLRRPSVSASLLNALAHQRADAVAQLFEIGEDLRTAQARGAGDELRELMKARQRAIRDLIDAAGEVAVSRGTTVTQGIAREIQETLLVAVSDPIAEDMVRAGRLTGGVRVGSLEPPATVSEAAGGPPSGRPTKPRRDEVALQRAWRDARQRALEVRRDADQAERAVAAAAATAEEIDQDLRRAKDEVTRLTKERSDADQAVAAARKARSSAERAAKAAAGRAARAEAAAKAE